VISKIGKISKILAKLIDKIPKISPNYVQTQPTTTLHLG
jgi:hypothetical protein